jgi:hypothetical protein
MEWIIGIYLIIGVHKTIVRLGERNPALKPAWMTLERNPIKIMLLFTFHVLVWPLAKS